MNTRKSLLPHRHGILVGVCGSCGSEFTIPRGIETSYCQKCQAVIEAANCYTACRKCGKVYQYRTTAHPPNDRDLCPWCKGEIDGIKSLLSFEREKECYSSLVVTRIEEGHYANHRQGPMVCETCGFGTSALFMHKGEGEHFHGNCRYCEKP